METKKVLIVEDEIAIRIYLEQALEDLEDEGVEIITAVNGEEAMETIQAERPNLVILDIMMPIIDGFEVCNKVKNELGMNDIYIIMLTAKGREAERDKGLSLGADAYITKPFSTHDLVANVNELLQQREQED